MRFFLVALIVVSFASSAFCQNVDPVLLIQQMTNGVNQYYSELFDYASRPGADTSIGAIMEAYAGRFHAFMLLGGGHPNGFRFNLLGNLSLFDDILLLNSSSSYDYHYFLANLGLSLGLGFGPVNLFGGIQYNEYVLGVWYKTAPVDDFVNTNWLEAKSYLDSVSNTWTGYTVLGAVYIGGEVASIESLASLAPGLADLNTLQGLARLDLLPGAKQILDLFLRLKSFNPFKQATSF